MHGCVLADNLFWVAAVRIHYVETSLSLDRLEGELSLFGRKVEYTVSIDSPNSDDQVCALIDEVREGRGNLATMAGGRRVEFALRHNGKTIMEKVYQ